MLPKSPVSLLIAATTGLAVPIPKPLARRGNLPTPIAVSTAKSYLSELTVAAESNSPAYDRDEFHTWIAISGNCNTREYVLRRDGVDVETSNACTATSGTWYSDYDGETWTSASDVDIDHIVPLKEAWVSGARLWSASQREAFANDITRPQLLAVTDNINQSKGDRDLAEWLPPREAYQCEYVRAWIDVKHHYDLTIDQAEKDAASDVLYHVC
ncbi:hypothetical protein KC331_g11071 [Hortaea werneckii]|uniref:GmrSD restriction endonucleases C-terminal domain-containing protein n=1 Tax=Hortaea werneckii TaxID=91943 RepID=A0A3M7CMU4_HORWE|nr:hypothetical protein KC331_g11071 [Hortaea werneckii]KAI7710546.1 hypothetical protein KC353_g9623 [Hortaea werneckii]RMY53438.1 hypothetical protein D0865_05251 [Hortaea werneckii]